MENNVIPYLRSSDHVILVMTTTKTGMTILLVVWFILREIRVILTRISV
jgi:hypothetical protein